MTEEQAWREIAARIEKGTWQKCGLCYEIDVLSQPGFVPASPALIDADTRAIMLARVKAHLTAMSPQFCIFCNTSCIVHRFMDASGEPGARILAAYWLALEAAAA